MNKELKASLRDVCREGERRKKDAKRKAIEKEQEKKRDFEKYANEKINSIPHLLKTAIATSELKFVLCRIPHGDKRFLKPGNPEVGNMIRAPKVFWDKLLEVGYKPKFEPHPEYEDESSIVLYVEDVLQTIEDD